jgi:predicted TIM-barrel fold metal-dependent hydrolase
MQDDHWLRNFALLEKHRMSWDMRIPYWHLAEGAEVARPFREFRWW